ncbi:hypothetical protein [Amnibacterium sp.]|uniref:hypothetical protein n=1 Tax=Amnibacterium sp. TaxID=1872496 RepID=UPI003F7B436E
MPRGLRPDPVGRPRSSAEARTSRQAAAGPSRPSRESLRRRRPLRRRPGSESSAAIRRAIPPPRSTGPSTEAPPSLLAAGAAVDAVGVGVGAAESEGPADEPVLVFADGSGAYEGTAPRPGVGSNRTHPMPSKYSSGQAWRSSLVTVRAVVPAVAVPGW